LKDLFYFSPFIYFKFQVKTHKGLRTEIQKVEIKFLISMELEYSQPYHHLKYYFEVIDNIKGCCMDEIHFYTANLCSTSFLKGLKEDSSKFQIATNYDSIYHLFLLVLCHKDNVFPEKFLNLKDRISLLASFNYIAQSTKSLSFFLFHFLKILRQVSIYFYSLNIQAK